MIRTSIFIFAICSVASSAFADDKKWTAMSVYSNGQLVINENLGTEQICHEALCMTKDHMTCEEKAEADKIAAEAAKQRIAEYEKRKAAYRLIHPCATKLEDWGKDQDGKTVKKTITRCPLLNGGEEDYDENGSNAGMTIAGGIADGGVIYLSGGGPSSYISKQVCFQYEADKP